MGAQPKTEILLLRLLGSFQISDKTEGIKILILDNKYTFRVSPIKLHPRNQIFR